MFLPVTDGPADVWQSTLCCLSQSFRSPWSNKYEPPIEDGAIPSVRLRKLEVEANKAFDQYRDLWVLLVEVLRFDIKLLITCLLALGFVLKLLWRWRVFCVSVGLGQWLRWSHSHQEGRRWLQEDQGVLGLHPRCGSAGENDLTGKLIEHFSCRSGGFLIGNGGHWRQAGLLTRLSDTQHPSQLPF